MCPLAFVDAASSRCSHDVSSFLKPPLLDRVRGAIPPNHRCQTISKRAWDAGTRPQLLFGATWDGSTHEDEQDGACHGSNRARSRLENPRLPVPNEYLAGWALTQNNTACLEQIQASGFTPSSGFPESSDAACREKDSTEQCAGSDDSVEADGSDASRGTVIWGEATMALMNRVDITRDHDQRRLAASRCWQRLQDHSGPEASPLDTTGNRPPSSITSWVEVSDLFDNDVNFVLRERERAMQEAAESMPEPWRNDPVSRAWVASHRLSVFETRRQAQRFFSWGIPDDEALDCILEPGKRVLEVGSGLGYWAYLLKIRSGDDGRVRCLDPYAPAPHAGGPTSPFSARSGSRPDSKPSSTCGEGGIGAADADGSRSDGGGDPSTADTRNGGDHSGDRLSSRCPPKGLEQLPSGEDHQDAGLTLEEEAVDVWFGEGRAAFTRAERGSFELISGDQTTSVPSGGSTAGGFRDWSLLICWPSDGQWPLGCLEKFEGDDFFYVGEGEGGSTRMPWETLRDDWRLERRVEIPRWPGFNDALWWYRRRGAPPLVLDSSAS